MCQVFCYGCAFQSIFFFQFTNLLNLLEIHAAAPCIIYDCHGGLCEGGATHLHVTMYSSMMSQSFYFGYMGNCLIVPTFHVLPEFFIKKKERKKKEKGTQLPFIHQNLLELGKMNQYSEFINFVALLEN